MNSRDKILHAVRAAKPAALDLPPAASCTQDDGNLVQRFSEAVKSIGASCTIVKGWESLSLLYEQQKGLAVLNGIDEIGEKTISSAHTSRASELEELHAVFLRGRVGVAENGAVWIPESYMGHRLLPFICERLVIAVESSELVPTLKEAYVLLAMEEEGYGVFIAGPSKSADIEQSLVIGAHGPLGLSVYVVE